MLGLFLKTTTSRRQSMSLKPLLIPLFGLLLFLLAPTFLNLLKSIAFKND